MSTKMLGRSLGAAIPPQSIIHNNSYKISVPDYDNPRSGINVLFQGALRRMEQDPCEPSKAVKQIGEFVRISVGGIDPEKYAKKNGIKTISLEESISKHIGLCAERAAVLCIILNKMKFEARFSVGRFFYKKDNLNRKGISLMMDHAWVKVRFGGIGYAWFLADPEQEIYKPLDSRILKRYVEQPITINIETDHGRANGKTLLIL